MTDPTSFDRTAFPTWAQETVRFADTDRQGHINNAVYATFCETGRTRIIYHPADPLNPPGTEFVIARLVIDFRAEGQWPGVMDIGTGVKALGRSSFTLDQVMLQGDTLTARAETVIVLMDSATRKSTPLTDTIRARLQALLPPTPAA